MNYIIICAESQEEFLEILSCNMTLCEKYLDGKRLIQEKKKRGALRASKGYITFYFAYISWRLSKHLFSSTSIKVTLQETV